MKSAALVRPLQSQPTLSRDEACARVRALPEREFDTVARWLREIAPAADVDPVPPEPRRWPTRVLGIGGLDPGRTIAVRLDLDPAPSGSELRHVLDTCFALLRRQRPIVLVACVLVGG